MPDEFDVLLAQEEARLATEGGDEFDLLLAQEEAKRRAYAGVQAIEDAEVRREREIGRLENRLDVAEMPQAEGEKAIIEIDPDAAQAYREARRTGLVTDLKTDEELAAEGVEIQPASLLERIGDFARRAPGTFAYKTEEGDRIDIPMPGLAAPLAQTLGEVSELMWQAEAEPPGGRTVRKPTVLSTAIDVQETLQRILLSPLTKEEDEGILEGAARAVPPPTWAQGSVPRDSITAWKQISKSRGWDTESWGNTLLGIPFAIFTDPVTYAGIGAPGKASTAVKQSLRIARKALKSSGLRGANLNAASDVAKNLIINEFRKGTSHEEVFTGVRKLLGDRFGDEATRAMDAMGPEYFGEAGLRFHLPFQHGVEVVSARRIGEAADKGKALWKKAEGSYDALRAVREAFDPAAAGKFDEFDGGLDFYEDSQRLLNAPEHAQKRAAKTIGLIGKHHRKASPGEELRLINADLTELRKMASEGESVAETRNFTTVVLNAADREARTLWKTGLLRPHGDLGIDHIVREDELAFGNAVRDAYAKMMRSMRDTHRAGEAMPSAEEMRPLFEGYLAQSLKPFVGEEMAVTAAGDIFPRAFNFARQTAPQHADLFNKVPHKLQKLVQYHDQQVGDFLKTEQARIETYAHRARKFAETEERRLIRKEIQAAELDDPYRGGVGSVKYGTPSVEAEAGVWAAPRRAMEVPDAKSRIKAAGERAFQHYMDKAAKDRDDYFHTFLRNTKGVRRRQVGRRTAELGASAKRKIYLDLWENWEAGQEPTTDILQSLGARTYSHIRMKSRMDTVDLALGDRRWAVPYLKSKGLRAKDGWHEMAHPYTGERFVVRGEIMDHLDRMVSFHDPGTLEKMARYYDGLLSRWKSYATFGRPVFYNLRNMVDDGWRMWMAGYDFNPVTAGKAMELGLLAHLEIDDVGVEAIAQAKGKATRLDKIKAGLRQKLKEVAGQQMTNRFGKSVTKGEFHRQAIEHGIVDKGYVTAELTGDIPQNTHMWGAKDIAWNTLNPFSRKHVLLGPEGFFLQAAGGAARASENHRRLTLFLHHWQKGESFEEAAKLVNKWLFDYKRLTEAERKVARRIAPFYTFSRKNIPRQIEAMIRNPGRYAALGKAKRSVEEKAEERYGPIGVVRQYMDDLWAWRLPWMTKGGSHIFWNTGLSMTDVNVLGAAVPGMEASTQDEIWDRMTPVFDIARILAMKKDPRTGLSMAGKWDEPDKPLLRMIQLHNAQAKVTRTPTIPIEEWETEDGVTYPVVPRHIVRAYEKILPNVVAYGRLMGRDKVNPFAADEEWLRTVREWTGQSPLPLNPLKAEAGSAMMLNRGPAAGIRTSDDAPVRRTY